MIDTLTISEDLIKAGLDEGIAKAVAKAVNQRENSLATKDDLMRVEKALGNRIDSVERVLRAEMQGLEGKMQGLEGKMQGLESKMQGLRGEMKTMGRWLYILLSILTTVIGAGIVTMLFS